MVTTTSTIDQMDLSIDHRIHHGTTLRTRRNLPSLSILSVMKPESRHSDVTRAMEAKQLYMNSRKQQIRGVRKPVHRIRIPTAATLKAIVPPPSILLSSIQDHSTVTEERMELL
jgi:hypothetical protein